jgi:hypothetical protein
VASEEDQEAEIRKKDFPDVGHNPPKFALLL